MVLPTWRSALASLASLALLVLPASVRGQTATPIAHLIVVVGENLSFDNLFGTYEPRSNAKIRNLLSQGIVNRDGSPGPEFSMAAQRRAEVRDLYQVMPHIVGTYGELPRPGTTYAPGLPRFAPDVRFPALLPNGPFQITKYIDYTAAVGDPVHRFFQMWQQVDGGRRDLFVWVDETSGEGSQNRADPDSGTNQGAVAMGFYNMATGDAPYFRQLADSYALSDNHHQPVMGGTGANFQALATGHAIAYTREGGPAEPPPNQVENPDPSPDPTIGTRIRATGAAPTPNARTRASPASRRSGPISAACLTGPSTKGIVRRAPITWSTTTIQVFWPPANRHRWGRRCTAFRRRHSQRSPRRSRRKG